MKKEVVAVLLGVFSALCFAGCKEEEKKPKLYLERFFLLSDENSFAYSPFAGTYQKIFVDKETRVIYLYSDGFFTYLVDAEGKPLLYEGDWED